MWWRWIMWRSGDKISTNHLYLGNFVTDAMVWAYRASAEPVVLAIINSGGIRASFDRGNITMEDLLISFPFRNTFDIVLMRGLYLRQTFEHSVANMMPDGKNEAGRFLQVCEFYLAPERKLFNFTAQIANWNDYSADIVLDMMVEIIESNHWNWFLNF